MAERLAVSRIAAGRAEAGFAGDELHANLGPRLLAYALDTVVLFGFTMVFAAVAFLNILLRSDSGRSDVSDQAIWTSVIVLMLTVPSWFAANLLLMLTRKQTVGQYVLGLGITDEFGDRPRPLKLVAYWLALHPLLFHPFLAGFWFLLAYASISLSQSEAVFVGSLAVGLASMVGPLANFIFLILDPQRRAIHDRVAGLKVVSLD
jgi:uncharacterized RDD family membrane protein YckC